MTQQFILRAMATNYSGGHSWDHLDGEACSKAADEIAGLRTALQECVDLFEMAEPVPLIDRQCENEVRNIGQAIGYGALMTTASALWRAALYRAGMPVGGEFVASPCRASVTIALKKARAALALPVQDQTGGAA